MNNKKNILFLFATLGLFSACDDDISTEYKVDDALNTIVLHAGVNDGGSGVQTRARDEKHGKHVLFKEGNKLALRIDGTWTGKETISQTTTATTGGRASTTENDAGYTHNLLTMNPKRFWNDYGVADPNNAAGRAAGLTIYGAAVNDKDANAPTIADWTSLTWELPKNQTGGWAANDLLTSNNIRPGGDGDGTYKFDDFKTNYADAVNILEFTHAMSEMTVVLTAGAGFPGSKFEGDPTVTLLKFKYTGTVDIEHKTSTPTSDVSDIEMKLDAGGMNNSTATFNALVYPGNKFDKIGDKDVDILSVTADGNTFVVTAAKLNDAIQKAIDNRATTGYPIGTSNLDAEPKTYDLSLVQGWNYKLLITVNKTSIDVVATIVNWETVTAETEAPKIRINKPYGLTAEGTEVQFTETFDFFRSTTIGSGYSNDATVTYSEGSYSFSTPLYWPTHSIHYFFRGVYPKVYDEVDDALTPADKFSTSTADASTIAVENVAYVQKTYPSDLAIGYPRTTDETCEAHSKTVATDGICATEGEIRMNFRYVMSQVEVKLTSAAGNGHVNIDGNTVIKIAGGYTTGNIKMEDGSAVCTGNTSDWEMKGGTALDRLDAIVPQTLGDMKFIITVKNDENDYDTYECKIGGIKIADDYITAWEPGKKYVYSLELQKTGIKVTATLKDWVTVEASENVWF